MRSLTGQRDERIVVRKLACTGHDPLPSGDGRCFLCGRERDMPALAQRYRYARANQAELALLQNHWLASMNGEKLAA